MIAGIVVLLGVISLILIVAAYWRGYKAGIGYGILGAKTELQNAHAAFGHARAQWEDWERKAESFRSFNSGILVERDKWQRLYTEQSIAHGNAQAIMMGAIEYMGKKLTIAGVSFEVPAVLKEVQQEFVRTHVTPVLQQIDRPKIDSEKSSPKDTQVG